MRFARINVSNSFDIPSFSPQSAIGSASRGGSVYGGDTPQPIQAPPGFESSEFTDTLTSTPGLNNAMRSGSASFAITNKANRTAEKIYEEARSEAEDKIADAKRTGGIFSTIGKVVGTALPLAFCDMRVKHDIAPLDEVDVSDELADLAFAVKALRECS